MKRIILALALGMLSLPLAAHALDIVTPDPECTLAEGRITVIGHASRAEKGKAEFGGQTTTFRVKDGVWSVVLNLPAGTNDVAFTVGSETLKAKWVVDPSAKKGAFKYHPGIETEKCANCHGDNAKKLTRDDQVVEICQRCHKSSDMGQFVHGPVAMGLCAACHDTHGSTRETFLRLKIMDLCQDCHNQPVSEKHRKNAGDELCTECHNPHASSKQFMLR